MCQEEKALESTRQYIAYVWKCFTLIIGKQDEQEFNYHMMMDNVIHPMIKTKEIKDIGVTIDCWLRFEKHVNGKIETANKLVGIIR